jgi:hypothetical protein
MSFSKRTKGSLDEVVRKLPSLVNEVTEGDEKDGASDFIKKQHRLAAESAANEVERILNHSPELHAPTDAKGNPVEMEVSVSIYGSASENGGSFGANYTVSKKA